MWRGTLTCKCIAPVATQELGQVRKLVLLDQEVRLGTSTLASARRAADEGRDAGSEAALAQRFHLRHRPCHRGDEWQTGEELFGFL